MSETQTIAAADVGPLSVEDVEPVRAAIYDLATGRILMVFTGDPANAEHQMQDGMGIADLPQGDEQSYYINTDTGRANLRDESPAVLSSDSVPADFSSAITLSRLRAGSVVTVAGAVSGQVTVDDGTLELTFGMAGPYRITVAAPFPATEKTVIVYAT